MEGKVSIGIPGFKPPTLKSTHSKYKRLYASGKALLKQKAALLNGFKAKFIDGKLTLVPYEYCNLYTAEN
jgi:hypothetical protein